MRVRLGADWRLLWNYAVHDLQEGAEFIGDLARHLHATGAPVEVLEHDPAPEPSANPPQTGPDGPEPVVDPEGLDIAGTIDTVLSWVGTDPARARHALEVEQARGDAARATLVGRLQQLAAV